MKNSFFNNSIGILEEFLITKSIWMKYQLNLGKVNSFD
ncbi:hypothetical protein LEP1GSC172_0536 [Leptospira noguchii]|uniref:Uncharacterized protein n=2 Tax=Leptospira noguchii TaxID=28182 RepID=T0GUA7_9LEPT|nr:hypothetical protein LEP1GSC172_0536 [Leptospira noguchii]EQA70936.1 hypothetical protein LEP1GSC059_3172 [Leptospira noguchii serovar Panama str. CZ214]